MRSAFLPLLLLAAIAAAAPAQSIDGPDEVDAGKPAWFSIADVPDGASAVFFASEQLTVDSGKVAPNNAMFWTDTAGTYSVFAVVTTVVIDWETKIATVKQVPLTKTIVVEGDDSPDPTPTPDPGPLPDGLKVVFILEESSQRTASQAEVMTALRRWCSQQGIAYKQLDQDQPTIRNWAAPYKGQIASSGAALPALVVSVQRDDGSVYFVDVTTLPGGSREAIAAVEEVFGQ